MSSITAFQTAARRQRADYDTWVENTHRAVLRDIDHDMLSQSFQLSMGKTCTFPISHWVRNDTRYMYTESDALETTRRANEAYKHIGVDVQVNTSGTITVTPSQLTRDLLTNKD